MVEQLKRILCVIDFEMNNIHSDWQKEHLTKIVKPEMEELYAHLKNGEMFFKYGSKQRMLESTYLMTDSIKNLQDTNLGKEILKLQEMYNTL